ncbi:MAG: SCO family protein [Frankiaceae bacterium]|nr:SCO family protein [Frankiaceae bacterium]MBV9871883.1 SCO family protein [Frankiaceae bacterium]
MRNAVRAVLIACAICLSCAGCGGASSDVKPVPAAGLGLHGNPPSAQIGRPAFTLSDTAGRAYDFHAQTAGHVTLLYAGYTHCPDECPTTMATIASALRSLSPTAAAQVKVVFLTVDPRRDNRKVMRTWLDGFHPPSPFVGLTGPMRQVKRAEIALAMPAANRKRAPESYKSGAYAVEHFDGLLAYGRDDRLETIYPSGVRPSELASDLRTLVGG